MENRVISMAMALVAGVASLSACGGSPAAQWGEGPGYIIEPPNACGVQGVWRMAPSPLNEGRTLVEFLTLSSRDQGVSGARMEVDCSSLGLRLIGQPRYGRAGGETTLGERGSDSFELLNELNADLRDADWFRAHVAEACRLNRQPDREPDFTTINEFVEAAGRVGDEYFAGKQCNVMGPPTLVRPMDN